MWQHWSLQCFLLAIFVHIAGAVQELYSHQEFTDLLARAGNQPVIVDFYSPSCGPCHMIAPVFRKVAVEYAGRAVFAKIDCNVNHVTPPMMGVAQMPTFQIFRNQQKVHEWVGADERQLRQSVQSIVAIAEQESAQRPPKQPPQQPPQQPQQQPPQQQQQRSRSRSNTPQEDDSNVELSAQSLTEFFQKVDPKLARKEIVDSYLRENSGNIPILLNFLQSQYGQVPRTHSQKPEQPQSKPKTKKQKPEQPRQAPQEDPKAQEAKQDKPKSTCDVTDVESMSTERLRRELARREEEEAESEVEQDEWRRTHNPCSINRNRDRTLAEKVVIIGGGPSGTTAAIYAARANLCPLVIAPAIGGQLMAKGVDVENYPGMPRENGGKMIQVFKQQAQSFFAEFMEDTVVGVNVSQRPFTIETSQGVIKAHSMIISTGADSKWLDVEGEYEYRGHGVSACAACDGYLYKGKQCIVVGGGDTAMEAALMLSRICSSVTVVHRRDSFRASWAMQQRVLDNSRIAVRWNTEITRFTGRKKNVHGQWRKFLTHVELSDSRDRLATADKLSVDAVFVAIGHDPNTGFLQNQVETDDEGYLSLFESSTKTSVPGVFAAGDVADHTYRQAVTSAGTGSMAALDVEKYLSSVDMQEDQCVRQEDFTNWSLKDLRAQVKLLGLKCFACYEPSDFVATLRASF